MSTKSDKLARLCGSHVIPNEVITNDFEIEIGDVLEFHVGGGKRKEHLCIATCGEEAFMAPVARMATTGKLVVTRSQIASYKRRGNDIVSDLREKSGDDYAVKFTGRIPLEEFEVPFEPYIEEE